MPTSRSTHLAPRYPDAIWQRSSNFSVGRPLGPPAFIVIHITDGQPSVKTSADRFCKPTTIASPHFLVGLGAEVYQFVGVDDRAWHAKGWNNESIGIEHVARSPGELDQQWFVMPREKRRALLPDNTLLDPTSGEDPGFLPTAQQLRASAKLAAWICNLYVWPVNRDRIRPHCDCPDTTHLDCGRDVTEGGVWPWTSYLAMVTEEYETLKSAR